MLHQPERALGLPDLKAAHSVSVSKKAEIHNVLLTNIPTPLLAIDAPLQITHPSKCAPALLDV